MISKLITGIEPFTNSEKANIEQAERMIAEGKMSIKVQQFIEITKPIGNWISQID